eukprot:m51a1_g6791 putative dna repair endonuclease xpf (831) ;mRNA; f:196388-199858
MLAWQRSAFVELLEQDGLLVASRGLGTIDVALALLRAAAANGGAVLVLNATTSEQTLLCERLALDPSATSPHVLTADVAAKDRLGMYRKGGVFFASSRILIVDLLCGRVPAHNVTGFLVLHADKVTEDSTEAFILRVWRSANKEGFIKAVTEDAVALTRGYARAERLLRALHVQRLHLWPRFRSDVQRDLEARPPDVVQLAVSMTPHMRAAHSAVTELVRMIVKEIAAAQGLTPQSLVGDDDKSMLTGADMKVRAALEPVWNKVGPRARQLTGDLASLRKLLSALTQYDCVSFLEYVEMLEQAHFSRQGGTYSVWLFTPAAEALFKAARARVYSKARSQQQVLQLQRPANAGEQPRPVVVISPVLEENPKWVLLLQVLQEIEAEDAANPATGGPGRVVVVVKDDRVVGQLQQYLANGARSFLRDRLSRYISKREELSQDPAEAKTKLEPDAGEPQAACGDQWPEHAVQGDPVENFNEWYGLLPAPYVAFHSLASTGSLLPLLESARPKYIVLYDAHLSSVREAETFKAANPGFPLRVYFLQYEDSLDEYKFHAAIGREVQAFERLIDTKATMVIPRDEDVEVPDSAPPRPPDESARHGGIVSLPPSNRLVLVDLREFRSSLPSMLHQRGMRVRPTHLEVGDYILSHGVAVERKSLSDLIGSLKSGRLYSQAEAMCKAYKVPVLLIEWHSNEAFEMPEEASPKSPTERLVLLTLHFPRLRIVWSRSPATSAELFEKLKEGRMEPDPDALPKTDDDEDSEVSANHTAQEMLQKMPGVTSRNWRNAVTEGMSLSRMAGMSEKELAGVLKNEVSARTLYAFLNKKAVVEKGDDD